jgi:2-dehydrotetronate isomerase
MPKFAANLTTLFNELPLPERFTAAAKAGFEAVEVLFPYEHKPMELAEQQQINNLTMALINLPPGDWAKGERGISALPGRENEFNESIALGLEYATEFGCRTVHVMAGIVDGGLANTKAVDTYIANLSHAAEVFGAEGIAVTIEPLNVRAAPGYMISRQGEARDIIQRVGNPNLGLQFDFYHVQIMEGDLATRLREFMPIIRHIQIAGVPERHEPDTGEVNYPYLFALLDELSYDGYVGAEYHPRSTTEAGLDWFRSATAEGMI